MTRARPVAGRRRIAWLASYPRSGSTWLRSLLTHFASAAEEPLSINALEGEFLVRRAQGRSLFEEMTGLASSDCTDDEVEMWRPAVYRAFASQAPGRLVFLRTHEALRYTPSGESYLPDDMTVGAVYLIRNPLDVAVSLAFYMQTGFAESIAFLNHENRLKDTFGGLSLRDLPLLDWSGNAASWTGAPFPVLTVRYEDLLADTAGQLGRIARFVHHERASDRGRLARAVTHSAFSRLRENEEREGYKGALHGRFFRSGATGDWQRHLTAAQVHEVVSAHGRTMAAFGYSVP